MSLSTQMESTGRTLVLTKLLISLLARIATCLIRGIQRYEAMTGVISRRSNESNKRTFDDNGNLTKV